MGAGTAGFELVPATLRAWLPQRNCSNQLSAYRATTEATLSAALRISDSSDGTSLVISVGTRADGDPWVSTWVFLRVVPQTIRGPAVRRSVDPLDPAVGGFGSIATSRALSDRNAEYESGVSRSDG